MKKMNDICTDNRFEIIAQAKEALLDSTNIDTSPDEMACLDSFLFRCWQMGWLDKYDRSLHTCEHCYYELFDDKSYPCSRCECNMPTKNMWKPKEREHE